MNGLWNFRICAFRFFGMPVSFLLTGGGIECKLDLRIIAGQEMIKICPNYEQEEKGRILLTCQNIL